SAPLASSLSRTSCSSAPSATRWAIGSSESRCDASTDTCPGCSSPSSGHCWSFSSFPLSSSIVTTVGCTISPQAPSSSAADRQLLGFGPCRDGSSSAHLLRSQRTFPHPRHSCAPAPTSVAARDRSITQRHTHLLHSGFPPLTVRDGVLAVGEDADGERCCRPPCQRPGASAQRPVGSGPRQAKGRRLGWSRRPYGDWSVAAEAVDQRPRMAL